MKLIPVEKCFFKKIMIFVSMWYIDANDLSPIIIDNTLFLDISHNAYGYALGDFINKYRKESIDKDLHNFLNRSSIKTYILNGSKMYDGTVYFTAPISQYKTLYILGKDYIK